MEPEDRVNTGPPASVRRGVGGRDAVRIALVAAALLVLAFLVAGVMLVRGVWVPAAAVLAAMALVAIVLLMHIAVRQEHERDRNRTRLDTRLQALAGVGSLIVSSVDRTQLLNEIVRWVERELDVPAVSIMLMDERRRHLRFEVASGEKGSQVKSFTVELGHGVAGAVAASGEPLMIQDARKDPRQARDIAEAVGFPVESVLCVPMTLHGEVIGVIEALNKRSGPFNSHDEALLTVLAQQAALFLESARLYSELQQRVDEATAGLRTANQVLAAQKAKIETLVDEMESGVIATDAHDRVVMFNRMAERLLGVPEVQAIGQPALAVIHHPRLSELFAMPLALAGGRHSEEVELSVNDHALILRASVTLVEEADGYGRLALLTDITRLKELDRMKLDLVTFVSHELQGPLATIKGFSHLIQTSTEQDAPGARLVRLLDNQVSRMQWLVDDLLDVARIEAGVGLQLRRADIDNPRRLVQEIVDLHAVTAKDHRFTVAVADALPRFRADRGKLEQVLVNLVGNAVKYSPDGGEVCVTVRQGEGEVVFSVSDEGIGISDEDLPNLFQRFRRATHTHERISGTGIGLFLCRHLVEAHGGRIWGERRDTGSTFRFTIPLHPPPQATGGQDAPADPTQAG